MTALVILVAVVAALGAAAAGYLFATRRAPGAGTERADAEALLAHCVEHDVGVQIIKSIARKPWADTAPTHRCWYHPETEDDRIERGVRFALSTPGVTAIATVGDLTLLPRVLDAVERFEPMTDEDRAAVVGTVSEPGEGQEIIFPIATHFRRDG